MPAISPPATVLVTGANGYIGLWVVRQLLEAKYSARAAVRSREKGDAIVELFSKKLPQHAKNIEYIVVPDITAENAFDDAVAGVAGIVHIASPMNISSEHPDEIIQPAVQGTLSVLKSAANRRNGNLKRVLITSSVLAVIGEAAKVYNEDDWNDDAVREVRIKGKDARKDYMYAASKVLAERAAWDFYTEHNNTIPWDLTVSNTGWVYGPTVDDPPSPDRIPSTMGLFYQQFFLVRDQSQVFPPEMNFIDVRDLAAAYVRAFEVEQAGAQRIIMSSQRCTWNDWLNAARDRGLLPGLDKEYRPAYPTPQGEKICSNEKAKQVLGLSFRTLSETLQDVLDDFRARGWLAPYEG